MTTPSSCPCCSAPIAPSSPPADRCLICWHDLRRTAEPDVAPRFVPVPAPTTPTLSAPPRASVAAVVGALAFAAAWVPVMRLAAIAVAVIGVVMGLVAMRRRRPAAFAGLAVSLQALLVPFLLQVHEAPPAPTLSVSSSPEVIRAEPEAISTPQPKATPAPSLEPARVEEEDTTLAAVSIPDLVEQLKNAAVATRRRAARALASRGGESKNALRPLLIAMDDPDGRVRIAAARAVWTITLQTKIVLPTLRRGLEDDDPEVRTAARTALRQVEGGSP